MVGLLCLLLAPAEPTVTYTNGSLPLGRALAEISAQSGVKLEASDAYSARPVFLVLDGVPIDEEIRDEQLVRKGAGLADMPSDFQERYRAFLTLLEKERRAVPADRTGTAAPPP